MRYLRRWRLGMMVVFWRSWFRVLRAIYDYVVLGIPVRRWHKRIGLGMLFFWGPNASNHYPWLWVTLYDNRLRPWMAKRENAARGRWGKAYQRARWGC